MSSSTVRERRTRIDPETSDDELVLATRAGNSSAFGVLWDRHSPAALRAARSITSSIDPEDLVSEAFAKTFSAIRNGGGPTDAFRPYIFAAVRSAAATWGGKQKDVVALEYIEELPTEHTEDSLDLLSDKALLTVAFKDLPERWRTLLWYLEVEGMKPREIAPLMGMTPNAVSVLAARAREGFKLAWLQAHIKEPGRDPECRWVCERIVAQGRRRHVARADRARFDAHLERCQRCTMASAEIEQASSKLRAVLLPVIIGGPAALAYSAGSPAPATAASAPAWMPRGTARWLVVGGSVAAAGAVVAVAAVAAQLAPVGAPNAEESSTPSSALVVASPAPIMSPESTAVPSPIAPAEEAETGVDPQTPVTVPEEHAGQEVVIDPIIVVPPVVDPSVVAPPAGGPSVIAPPVVKAPVVDPPVVDSPVVEPPVVDPPVVDPPVIDPPVIDPPVIDPPVVDPPVVEPPAVEPPVVDPPVIDPPVIEPPVAEPVTMDWSILPGTTVPPTITGTGTPGAAVQIIDETGLVIASTLVGPDGDFSVRPDVDTLHQGMSISMRHTSRTTGVRTVSDPTGRLYFPVPGLAEDSDGAISRVDSDGDGRRDDLSLDVRGVAGSTASVSLDGETASLALLDDSSTIVSFIDIRPGLHRITLRYVDPATGILGISDTDYILVVP
ncbi:sigma-70 family RNA polymerase sigma factor [Microbacterium foliorum]|uniref:sigma-70 family RNA polymerase sigma factor n=1 Tax=Microbacterium foliorum TaxID=104336 RepID=UPI003735926C